MKKLYYSILLLAFANVLIGQNTITGTISGTDDGEPLIGANVLVAGTSDGAIADFDGTFTLSTNKSFPLDIVVSFVGYKTKTITVSNGNAIDINLDSGTLLTDEVVISASRRAEKLQEAPAAVSVISAKDVSASGGSVAPVRALINTPGVELAPDRSKNQLSLER